MMNEVYTGSTYEGSGMSNQDSYSTVQKETSTNESSQSSSTNGNSGTKSIGRKFLDVLNSILGRSKKPLAYVKKGKEVSFADIPFYDTSGTKLSFEKTQTGKLTIKRKGRPANGTQRVVDGNLKRELALSGNHGVARSVPQFRNRAHQHLRQTQEVRRKILSGEIETPGNKDAILRKQLKAEAVADGEVLDAAWLEEVRNHLTRNKGGDLKKLKAQIAAMANKKNGAEGGKTEGSGKTKAKADLELQDPRLPRVKKFSPKVVSGESADHVVKTKAVEGDEAVDALKKAIAKGNTKGKSAKAEEHNVVQRIEIKNAKELPKPGEAESRSLEIIRQLKGKTTAKEDGKAKDPVREMRENGWRTHTPKGERAESVDALSGERARRVVEQSPERANDGKNRNAAGGTFKVVSEQSDAAKTSDLAKVQTAQVTPNGNASGTNGHQNAQTGTNGSGATQQSSAGDMQSQSRGIENLQQLLTRMESSARVLTTRGSTTLRVTLRPPELGAVSVQIRENDGKYSVRMKVDNEDAARIVEQHAPQIRDAMADRGIRLDQLDVRSGQQQPDAFDRYFDNGDDSNGSRGGRSRGQSRMANRVGEATSEPDNPVLRSLKLGTNTMDTVG